MHRNLRVQDKETRLALLELYDSGRDGIPRWWLPTPTADLVALGYAERCISLTPPRRRIRLTKLGVDVVVELLLPKEE